MQSLYGAIANTNKKEIMAVSVDTVYQRVLAFANKEQRGYITPQEFNLFANQAQMEIFEQYFADVSVKGKFTGNADEYSDPLNSLHKKIGIFEVEETNNWAQTNMPIASYFENVGVRTIPSEVYKIGRIKNAGTPPGGFVEILSSKDFDQAMMLPLTSGSVKRPIAKITEKGISISPTRGLALISFIRKPKKVEWAYVIVNDKPLHNANISVDFELHPSEETELVYKILKFAGVNMKDEAVMSQAQGLESIQLQREIQ